MVSRKEHVLFWRCTNSRWYSCDGPISITVVCGFSIFLLSGWRVNAAGIQLQHFGSDEQKKNFFYVRQMKDLTTGLDLLCGGSATSCPPPGVF